MENMKNRFFELAERLEQIDEERLKISEELEVVMKNLGMESFHQDPQTGIVYQITKPLGRFVYYKEIDYIRTKKEGERSGSLSMKKAEEAGFTVLGGK